LTKGAALADAGSEALLETLTTLALLAAAEIEDVANSDFAIEQKGDLSPVTQADRRAEQVIVAGLARSFPADPVVAEEAVSAAGVRDCFGDRFFLVDPLDGTREFVARRSDYTVNIALILKGVPVAGVVCAPRLRTIYRGALASVGAACAQKATLTDHLELHHWTTIRARPFVRPPVIVASRSHMTAETHSFVARFPGSRCVSVGSSLKFCLVAEGSADLYPRFGPTMEWDTAAGDAILRAAGGQTYAIDRQPLTYAKFAGDRPFINPHFVASGSDAPQF
jgi:3'(2'), 5'-bisphosphate nucleotidase